MDMERLEQWGKWLTLAAALVTLIGGGIWIGKNWDYVLGVLGTLKGNLDLLIAALLIANLIVVVRIARRVQG